MAGELKIENSAQRRTIIKPIQSNQHADTFHVHLLVSTAAAAAVGSRDATLSAGNGAAAADRVDVRLEDDAADSTGWDERRGTGRVLPWSLEYESSPVGAGCENGMRW